METILLLVLAVCIAGMLARFQVNNTKQKAVSDMPEIPFEAKEKIGRYLWLNDTEFAIPLSIKNEVRIVKKQDISEVLRYEVLENGKPVVSGAFQKAFSAADEMPRYEGRMQRRQVSSLGLKLFFSTDTPPEVTLEFMKKSGRADSPDYKEALDSLEQAVNAFVKRKRAV